MFRPAFFPVTFACLVFLISSGSLLAASQTIGGHVMDATGAVVPGAVLGSLTGDVSPDADFSVKTVETANRALSDAARMAQGGAP